jgi:hypothetical protein
MSCEFISEMRVNSHSPILDMSLKEASVAFSYEMNRTRG